MNSRNSAPKRREPPMTRRHSFTFADLFAGIGGMRLAFEAVGGECVLTSEIDEAARHTYKSQVWRSSPKNHRYVDDVVV